MKPNPKLWFSINDRWFRTLEFALIIGTLSFFKEKTGSTYVAIIYWISWFLFYSWFLELGEYIGERIYPGKKFSRQLISGVLSTIGTITAYKIIINAVSAIESLK